MGVLRAAASRFWRCPAPGKKTAPKRGRASETAPAASRGGPAAPPPVTGRADAVLMAAVVLLIAFGVVMVYSASAVYANKQFGDGYHYLVRQSVYACLGLLVMVAVARVDYHRYTLLTYPALAGSLGLLLVVALGFGHRAGGAARWIHLGPINLQPAEVAKLAMILWLAESLAKKRERIRTFSIGFLPHVLMAGILMLLCMKQPDFGSAVMVGLLTALMLFAAGTKTGHILGALLLAAPLAWAVVATSPYRMRRVRAFLAPFEHRYDDGYQLAESLMGFGAGGVSGAGLGDSRQKLFFLPEAHTDFISAIVGEELGFVGLLFLIGLFVLVVVRGLRAAFQAADDYGTWLAVGISMFIGLQAFTNLAVAMGMLPTKGLVLPFLSYGGSSLLVNCTAVGILLNVSRARSVCDEVGEPSSRAQRKRGVRGRPALGGTS